MPIFGLFWLTSWVNCLVGYSQGLLRVPDYLTGALPARVLSVVGNPLESYNPLVFRAVGADIPQINNSSIKGYNSSLTTLPAFGFHLGWRRQASTLVPPLLAVTKIPDVVENRFCKTASEQKHNPQPIASPSQSASTIEALAGKVSPPNLPQRILQVMQNLFHLPDRLEGNLYQPKPKHEVVVRTGDKIEGVDPPGGSLLVAQRGFWLYSKMRQRLSAASQSSKDVYSQVWVNGKLIAQFSDKEKAELMAQNLQDVLADDNQDISQLQPALVNGVLVGKLGDKILFVIDGEAIAHKETKRTPELFAVELVNNLRVALGVEPLTLVQAQSRMYGLVETEKKIEGIASWYGGYFHGRLTANGETYNQFAMTAAHPSLPFDTYLKVTNKLNGDAAIVRINDRGPYIPPRSLDLSLGAARCIKSEEKGVIPYEAVLMQQLQTP